MKTNAAFLTDLLNIIPFMCMCMCSTQSENPRPFNQNNYNNRNNPIINKNNPSKRFTHKTLFANKFYTSMFSCTD